MRSFAPVLVVIAYAACGGAQRRGTSAPEVTVLELGSAPRQRVRIVPVLHAVERVAVVGKLRTDEAVTNTVLETGHRAHDLPSAELVLRCTADEVAVDHARVRCEVESATVNSDTSEPALRTRLAQELEQARGARIAWTLLPNGSFSDVVVDAPHAAARLRERLPMLRTMLRSVAFPDVEIGVGAAWSVTTHEQLSGVSWDMTRTYRLRALTSTSADLDVEGAFSAPSQVLSTEPNRSTRLRSGSGHVIGQMHVPLQGMVATGSSHATTEVELSVVNRRLRLSSLLRSESFTDVRKLGDAAVPATDAASTTTPPSEPPQPLAPAPASVPAPP